MADNRPPWVTNPPSRPTAPKSPTSAGGDPPWVTNPITQAGPTQAQPKPKPQPSFGNVVRGMQGTFESAALHGILAQPVRWGMEAIDFGGYRKKLEQRFPGKSKDWYDQQIDKLYDQTIIAAREKAAQKVADNPYYGQAVGNFAAGILGSAGPDWFIAPGMSISRGALKGSAGQVLRNVGGHVAKQAGVQGGVSGLTDLAAQGMDIGEGIQEGVDSGRLLTSAGLGAGFGAGFAGFQAGIRSPQFQRVMESPNTPEWVKKAFTEPEPQPEFRSQVGQAPTELTPELQARQREVFAKGTADDIKAFYDEVGGPRPGDSSIGQWLEQRAKMGDTIAAPKPDVINQQIHRDTIRAHVDNTMKTWKNAPKVNIITSIDELDPSIRGTAIKDGITPDNTIGFVSQDRQVNLFANKIQTPEEANAVLFHEALGHYGLAERFGSQLDNVLNTLVTRNVDQFRKRVDKWQKANPGAYGGDRLRAAEEVLAEMSKEGPLPKSIADALVSSIKRFARNMGLDLKVSDAEVDHILAMAHDAVINGKGRDVVANRFGGLTYQPTDFGSSEPNRQMYAGQRSAIADQIPEDRWFTGPDGKPRFEISDDRAEFNPTAFDIKKSADLDEVLIHPELFKTYPELHQVKVELTPPRGDGISGYFEPHEGKIYLVEGPYDHKSTILHEIQHWIQFKEGFALGGNQGMFRLDNVENLERLKAYYTRELSNAKVQRESSPTLSELRTIQAQRNLDKVDELIESSSQVKELYDIIDESKRKQIAFRLQAERYKAQMDDLFEQLKADPADKTVRDKYWEAVDKFNKAIKNHAELSSHLSKVTRGLWAIKGKYSNLTFDMYKLLTGEVEARDTQLRVGLDAEQRKRIPPYSIEGIQPNEMIPYFGESRTLSQQDPLGRPLTPAPDEISALRNDPKFWTDPEYRANVLEYMRMRESQTNRQMTPEQLREAVNSGEVDAARIERIYESIYKNYEKTYRSDAEVRRAANAAGFQISKVKNLKDMEDLSVRIFRAQEAAKVLDARLAKLAEKEGTPEWSAKDADDARKAIADHFYILQKLYDDKSELGRALRVAKLAYTHSEMRAYKELLEEEGGTLAPLADDKTLSRFLRSFKQISQGGANPNGVNHLVNGLRKPHWEDYLLSARVNMMLSGMSTHVTAVTDMIDGIGLDLMDSTAGLIPSLGREGLRALGIPIKPGLHPAEVGARYWGVLRAAMEASTYVDALRTLRSGSDRYTHGGRAYARIPVISKVGDLIAAEDQFFRAFATNMHLYGLGVRKAVEEARAKGRKLTTEELINAGTSYARNPSKDLLQQAERAAEENLLLAPNRLVAPLDAMRHTSYVGPKASPREKAVSGAQRAASFIVSFMLPFVRTATNSLYQRIWRRTPLTMLDPHTIADLREGGPKADIAMGRVMLATATTALMWEAAGKGLITGEGPEDPRQKAIKMGTGWRPKAVRVEDEEGNVRYQTGQNLGNRLNPFDYNSQLATIVASTREAFERKANEGQVALGMKMAVRTALYGLLDNSWIGDISDDIEALTDRRQGSDMYWDQWAADQVASFTPNLLAQIARVQDQGQPMTTVKDDLGQTIKNTLQARLPGLREQLPDRLTPFGEPVQSGTSLMGQSTGFLPQGNRITGGNYVEQTTDPAKLELQRLTEVFGSSVITPVQRQVKIDGETIRLTNEQYHTYQREVGQRIVTEVNDMISSGEWAEMDDEDKFKAVKKLQASIRKEVRQELFYEEEDQE